MSKAKTYLISLITQVVLTTCVIFNGYSQYLNKINITPSQDEFTFNYNWERDTLVSVTTINDSLWVNNDYAAYHFKKYDSNFDVTLDKRYVDTNFWYIFGRSMAHHQGGYYVGAQKKTAYNQNDTAFASLIKFDSLGNKVWDKIYYRDLGGDVAIKFIVPHDSLVVFSGFIYDTTLVGVDRLKTFVTAIDTSGGIIWDQFFTGFNLQPVNLKKTSDGGFILSAYTQVTAAHDTKVYKLDNLGNTEWVRTLGNTTESHWLGVEEAPSGEYICYGWKTVFGIEKSWLVKLGSNGVVLNDTLYNFSGTHYNYFNPEGNVVFTDAGAYIVGWYRNIGGILGQSYLAFVNYDLELQWFRHFEKRTYNDLITFIKPYPPNTEYLFMGGVSFSDDTTNSNDEWFIVVDSLGCDVFECSLDIEENSSNNDLKIHPNPARDKITIKSGVGIFKCQIINLSGQIIYQTESIYSTEKEYVLNVENLVNGYYIFQLEKGDKVCSSPLVISK